VGGFCSLDAQKRHLSNIPTNGDMRIQVKNASSSVNASELSPLTGSDLITPETESIKAFKSNESKMHNTDSKTINLMQTPHYVCLSAIPFQFALEWLSKQKNSCDLFVLMFQCGDADSLLQVFTLVFDADVVLNA